MTSRSGIALAVHRALLRTSRTSLARLWELVYRLIARAWVAYLARGERGAAAYLRGGSARGDLLPGISDVDVALVLPADPAGPGIAGDRARQRWRRLRRSFPVTQLLIDFPRIFEHEELRDVTGTSAFTYGLDGSRKGVPRQAGYFAAARPDRFRMLERPGLYGATTDWRLLTGPDRRPVEPARDPQLRRLAAWLELVWWWQWAFPLCVDPSGPRSASLCMKLVAEPARVWLWLAHGERASGRADVLHRALRRLPEEDDALRRALDLRDSLPESPEPPLDHVLPALVRLSARIAALIGTQLEDDGATEVRLAGADPAELVPVHGDWRPLHSMPGGKEPRLLPLCDWRGLVWPRLPDESFAPLSADPGDPAAIATAAASQGDGPYPAFHADGLLILPTARWWRARLRAVQCPATDPVSFALARGDDVARFPNASGWSAEDTARRAVAEHRPWLLNDPSSRHPPHGRGGALGRLFTAGRAALLLETLRDGEPELPVTVTETGRRLAARSSAAREVAEEALERYRDFAAHRTLPPSATVSAMRKLVSELPAYSDSDRGSPRGRLSRLRL